jgi:capsular exopolysaccharide synthesis family protein
MAEQIIIRDVTATPSGKIDLVRGAMAPVETPDLAPPEEGAGGVPWKRYFSALWRHKFLIIAMTALGLAGGVFASRLVPPQYTAGSTIWIEAITDQYGNQSQEGPIRAQGLLRSFAWVELLKSGVVLDSTALKHRLWLTPRHSRDSLALASLEIGSQFRPGQYRLRMAEGGNEWTLESDDGTVLDRGAPGDSIGQKLGFRWALAASMLSPGQTVEFSLVAPRTAATQLAKDLQTSMVENSNFLRITLTGTDPQRLASTLNALTDQFVSISADLKQRKLAVLTETLKDQVAYAAENLREAENRLEGFRVKTITLPSEEVPVAAGLQMTQPTVLGSFFGLKVSQEEVRRDRQALQEVLARRGGTTSLVDALQTVAAVRAAPDLMRALGDLSSVDAELRALRQRYTDEYKPVKDLEARVTMLRTQTIPALAGALVSQLRIQEETIGRQIATQSRDIQQIPTRTITEQRLSREVASADGLFRQLQSRYEETKLALVSSIPDIRVLDRAEVPQSPSKNTAPRIIFMGFGAGLALAIGLAIALDMVDHRFRYPDQVEKELGLTILGAVPRIKRRERLAQDPEEAAQVVEAFRAIRLNLAHSYGSTGPVLLTVSSPGAGDGKSLVSSNLALGFAEAGYRVVLLDGDIRRGELHRSFGIQRKPGLLDCLQGNAHLDDILRSGGHPNLTVVPCGTRFERGPELLGGPRMLELFAALKSRYNCVIIDSPPLGAGIDPFVLGATTGHLVLVMRAGQTDREFAGTKLKLFERLPVRILGAILNDVRTAEAAYRHYAYIYGYTADEVGAPREFGASTAEHS